jgi:hypothetical protein
MHMERREGEGTKVREKTKRFSAPVKKGGSRSACVRREREERRVVGRG